MPRKPKPLQLRRNLVRDGDQHAECEQWATQAAGKPIPCGRTVWVPALMFDEGDAAAIRSLAEWLGSAADWVEAQP